jgi:putative DNA primase/helicase
MSAIKRLIEQQWELERNAGRRGRYSNLTSDELSAIAATLGGEVRDEWIHIPSPGMPADDRSLVVRFSSADSFFVYASECPQGCAYAYVRAKLKLAPPIKRDDAERSERALRLWQETIPAPGTVVEIYLRSRAIAIPVPDRLRYHGAVWHRQWGGTLPAMVGLLTDVEDHPVAAHITFLSPDGSRKIGDPPRKTFGAIKGKGAAIRLSPAAAELCIGEGIETCLSVMQSTGRPVWAAGSTYGLKEIALPPITRSVILLGDGDDAGRDSCRVGAARLFGQGRRVRIAQAPDGQDFNDLLIKEP